MSRGKANEMSDMDDRELEEGYPPEFISMQYDIDESDYDPAWDEPDYWEGEDDDTFPYEIVTLEHSKKGQAFVLHIHMIAREDGTEEWEGYRWKQKLSELPAHHRAICVELAKAEKWGEELTEHFGRADDAQFAHNEFRRDPPDAIPF